MCSPIDRMIFSEMQENWTFLLRQQPALHDKPHQSLTVIHRLTSPATHDGSILGRNQGAADLLTPHLWAF